MFVINWLSTIKLQNNSEITNFLGHFFIPNWRSVIREMFVSILYHIISVYSAFFVQKSLQKEPKPYKTNEKYTYTTHTNPTFETPTQHTCDKQVANFMRISTVVSGVNPMFFSKFAVCTQ